MGYSFGVKMKPVCIKVTRNHPFSGVGVDSELYVGWHIFFSDDTLYSKKRFSSEKEAALDAVAFCNESGLISISHLSWRGFVFVLALMTINSKG